MHSECGLDMQHSLNIYVSIYWPAHEILVLIASASSKGSERAVSREPSLLEYTKNRQLALFSDLY